MTVSSASRPQAVATIIITTVDTTKKCAIKTIGLTGQDGGQLTDKANILAPGSRGVTTRIEDTHVLIKH